MMAVVRLLLLGIAVLACHLNTVSGDCDGDTLLALSAFYHATGGPNWVNKDRWMTGEACGTNPWESLSISASAVTRIAAASGGLVGSLPSQIGLLQQITNFKVFSNPGLGGTIPTQIGMMTLQSKFDAKSCAFSGPLPTELGRLTNLVKLRLQSNQLTGRLPSWLGQLQKITDFSANNNPNLCGTVPSELASFQTTSWSTGTNMGIACGVPSATPTTLPSLVPIPTPSHMPTLLPTLTPTPKPTQEPTFLPTAAPSRRPTPLPSRRPTPSPTAEPSQQPTPAPSDSPTPSPSISSSPTTGTERPTATPSNSPTPGPSPQPTLLPTHSHLPSPLPSPYPTQLPSVQPTVACPNGTAFSTRTHTCDLCGIGRYAVTFEKRRGDEGIAQVQNCSLCPAGKYNIEPGSKGCLDCAVGKLSASNRASCQDCQAGEFNSDNVECAPCPLGTYAPQALSGSCLLCPAGFHTSVATKATSCTSCDAGLFSSALSVDCALCPSGKFSTSGQAACSPCDAGKFNSATGSTSCLPCSAGFAHAEEGAIECEACSAGFFQSKSGQEECDACLVGKFAPTAASLSCTDCASGKDAAVGSIACTEAEGGFFLDPDGSGVTLDCPANSQCLGGDEMPRPAPGFWVDRRRAQYASYIYRCDRQACVGATVASVQKGDLGRRRRQRRLLLEDKTATEVEEGEGCWSKSAFDDGDLVKGCESDLLQCQKGSKGFVCASCEDGYTLNSALSSCVICQSSSNTLPIVVVGILACLTAVGLLFYYYGFRVPESAMRWIPLVGLLKQIDKGMLKVTWASYQIVSTISWNLSVPFPEPFTALLFALSFLQLDFLSLDCVSGQSNYFNRVLVVALTPIFLSLVLGVLFVVRRFGALLSTETQRSTRIANQHAWAFLLLTYCVLPPVSMVLFQALDCETLQPSGTTFLRSDSSIDCRSSAYLEFKAVVSFFIAVYQGLPLMWLALMWRVSSRLNPRIKKHGGGGGGGGDATAAAAASPSSAQLEVILEKRNVDPGLQYLNFLWSDYTPARWYYEVIEMYRRIIFIAVLPLAGGGAFRASVGCFLSIASVSFVREAAPFIRQTTNVLLVVAQYQILGTFLAALVILSDSLATFGFSDAALGSLLLAINSVVVLLSAWWCYSRLMRERERQQWRHVLTTQERLVVAAVMSSEPIISKPDTIDGLKGSGMGRGSEYDLDMVEMVERGESSVESASRSDGGNSNGGGGGDRSSRVLKQHLISAKDVVMSKRVGAGAYGEVFQGSVLGQPVAVKTMLSITEANVASFRAEILLAASLRHPNIVCFVGACWGDDLMAMCLEWVQRGTMADLLEDELQDLRWDDPLLRLALDVARGMAYLHGREYFDESAGEHKKCIIHRDLKPENCLISDFTSAKISDFGTSRAKAADDAVTMTAVGTPLFCAPEIVTAESYDEKCDVYSFGLFLLNMTTDKDIVEFIGDKWRTTFSKKKANMMKAIRCMQEEGWRPVTMEDPVGWAPPTINSLLVRCCSQDSRARPSFVKIIEDLQGPCALEIGGSKFLRHEQPTYEESSNKAHMDDGYHNSSNERKFEQQSSSKKDLGSEYSSEVELKAEQRLSQTAVNMVNPLRAVPSLGNDAQGKPDPHSGML